MGFVELTRVLPGANTMKWSVNTSNIVYFHATDGKPGVGCRLMDLTGKDYDVAESYEEVAAKFKDS